MGKKITRAQESARHAYRRALEKSLRKLVKGTRWKSACGSMFCEHAGWFINAMPSVYIFESVTKAVISVKPMVIDPILWDIVGSPENRDQPLSFRANGVWVCRPPYYAELDLEEDDDPDIVGERLLVAASDQLENMLRSYSLEGFLHACRVKYAADGVYLSSIIPTLIALHRHDEALAICEQACSQGLEGDFIAPEGSFVDMAVAYLNKSALAATRH